MIDAVTRNYYMALLFEERPELHMTMRYWKNMLPGDLARKIADTQANLLNSQDIGLPVEQFSVGFPFPDVFGWANKVNVMRSLPTQEWPQFILNLVSPEAVGNFHVTCDDKEPLTLTACALAIMQKKNEICRWDLQKPTQKQPEPTQTDLFS